MLLLLLVSPVLGALVSEPQPPPPRSSVVPTLSWLPVRLNHFDASNNDTFLMRYYYNNEFARSNNVVVVIGGPWSISPDWVTGGLPHELAEEIGAGLFYTEHRYYGQTRPTSGTTVPELRFLTIDQALGDLAQFIQHVQSDQFEGGRFSGGQVALAGCAHAGSLATWMRLAYPHLVSVAFSDSGPLLALDEFPGYLEVVWEVVRIQGGADCVATLNEAMELLFAETLTQEGSDRVSRMFNTCTPINGSDPLDTSTFFWWGVLQPLAQLVQAARPGDIAGACDVLTDPGVPVAAERLARWVRSLAGARCLQASRAALLAAHTNTSYDAPRSADRLWMYQSCAQLGRHRTAAAFPFHSALALPHYRALCRQCFADDFDDTFQREGVERTNLLFGGLSHLPDGVVSAAAAHDPAAPLAAGAALASRLAPVHLLREGSQCQVISAPGVSETQHVRAVRRAVLLDLQQLLAGQPPSPARAPAAAAVTITVILASLALVL